MKKELLQKYLIGVCSEDELDQVLDWFQTPEGLKYLNEDLDKQEALFNSSNYGIYQGNLSEESSLNSVALFNRIQNSKNIMAGKNSPRHYLRVAIILLFVGVFSIVLYNKANELFFKVDKVENEVVLIDTQTIEGQQKIFTLSDGTKIRLNENSTLKVPGLTKENKRVVELVGEAYFEVEKSDVHPFVVQTDGATIEVLGTKFNVKSSDITNDVQVSVVEGRVSLKSTDEINNVGVLLTKDEFGRLNKTENRITIEKARATNYVSWISKRLTYSGESLEKVSRQLAYLYQVDVEFDNPEFKNLKLTADFEKIDLNTTLATIAKTFNIKYEIKNGKVTWKD